LADYHNDISSCLYHIFNTK